MEWFVNFYQFYKAPVSTRRAMVGKPFKETLSGHIFVPVNLKKSQFNYGSTQGLIQITDITHVPDGRRGRKRMFTVGCASPDDLDIQVTFEGNQCMRRQDVIDLVCSIGKRPVTYLEVVIMARDLVGGGEVYT